MKKIVLALTLAFTLMLTLAGGASAITNGQPNGDAHPYVGLLVFDAEFCAVAADENILHAGAIRFYDGDACAWNGVTLVGQDCEVIAAEGSPEMVSRFVELG